MVLFQVARRLFDTAVAWLSALVFAGTELFWKFSASGQSTIWLMLIFLGLVWCLVLLEERERRPVPPRLGGSLALAAAVGALAGIGGLSRYSFAWMIVPVLMFLRLYFARARGKLVLCAAVAFLAVMAPWIARNLVLSQTCFGTAGYALVETTPHLPDDLLERSLHPAAALSHVTSGEVLDKFFLNGGEILKNDLPRLGGNWVCAFFLCGLLLPFRNPALQRFRLLPALVPGPPGGGPGRLPDPSQRRFARNQFRKPAGAAVSPRFDLWRRGLFHAPGSPCSSRSPGSAAGWLEFLSWSCAPHC